MKGYSQDRWFYYRRLTKKYVENSVYTVTKNEMKECVLITTNDCVKCKFVKPHLEKWCKENWYKFKEMEYWPWMDEVTSVPCAMIGDDVILDYEWLIDILSNKKRFY